ncbi:hypothetical protein SAMN07250955_10326 [Arboricoccus pini]|uniref:DUF6867 domain-containing protein n=1 Tax=Arboricoccus pini TaxID=1963835 RepID=A0A212QR66_9PROT|nr:hypothetical protein [Arboricoccus pini]SNB62062.1 hypothetical protein SAMN07250955_10326 [Arboricoccus pini]
MDLLGSSVPVFIGLTLILMGAAAFMAGRSIAYQWRPFWLVAPAAFGLALADRFLTYALFNGPLLHPPGLLLQFVILLLFAALGWRLTRVAKLCGQYPWRYARSGPWSYQRLQDD